MCLTLEEHLAPHLVRTAMPHEVVWPSTSNPAPAWGHVNLSDDLCIALTTTKGDTSDPAARLEVVRSLLKLDGIHPSAASLGACSFPSVL